MSTRLFQQSVWFSKFLNYTKSIFIKDQYTYKGLPAHWRIPKRMTPALEHKLNHMGLLYDDYAWTDKNILPVQEALKRVDPEIREMRQRRIDRANDMAHKHIGIPEHMYNHQGHPFDPNLMYLTPIMSEIYAEAEANGDMRIKHE